MRVVVQRDFVPGGVHDPPADPAGPLAGQVGDERSPDNVAPIVTYLASERSGWITGRIIHASGYEVALYNNPQPLVRLIGTGPWDGEDLAEHVERSFGPLVGRGPTGRAW